MEKYGACDIPLSYGKTDGKNIPYMPSDKLFMVGYNTKYGLLNVHESGNKLGEQSYFKGRVNIENLLSKLPSKKGRETESRVYNYIMTSYMNLRNHQRNPERQKHNTSLVPILEVLVDEGK